MKKLAITGGKGGTGKSTVAVLMISRMVREGKSIILCDCDVECPNDYLLVGQKLGKVVKKVYAEFPKLDKKRCRKCGLCVEACRNHAIFQAPKEYPVFIENLCSGCGTCWIVCPNQAIASLKEETGKIYLNKIGETASVVDEKELEKKPEIHNLWLMTGLAKARLEETGPVVREVKEFALRFATKVKADYIIFDTAPGTHCSVIAALLDIDLAYVVTEPTPMGAYDLSLILDLCRKLKVPAKIILNQADLGDRQRVEEIAKKFKMRIEKKIPYSKKIVQAYSKGNLLKLKNEQEKSIY